MRNLPARFLLPLNENMHIKSVHVELDPVLITYVVEA